MCLSAVTHIHSKPVVKPRIGWKVFYKYGNRLFGPFFGTQNYKPRKIYRSKRNIDILTQNAGQSYPSGFHVFYTRKEADRYRRKGYFHAAWVIRKVKASHIVCIGKQGKLNCFIAKRMMILP